MNIQQIQAELELWVALGKYAGNPRVLALRQLLKKLKEASKK
jgi:hypothetical protein